MANTTPRHRPRSLIRSFEAKALSRRPWAVKVADSLTAFFGSIQFLSLNLIIFLVWILINSVPGLGIPVFDPFPYTLLTMTVSLEAIFLTVIVLMSQNRQGLISSLREEMDLQINLFAEKEITKVLHLLSAIAQKQGIDIDQDRELQDMLKKLDQSYIERKLEAQIFPQPKPPFSPLFKQPPVA